MNGKMIAALALVLLLVTACGGGDLPEAPPIPVSPNGEPLIGAEPGTAGCAAAQAKWLEAADSNRDGTLDRAEFMADAQRWFAQADENGDGSITPDELTQLRLRLMPPAVRAAQTRAENERQRARERGRNQQFRPRSPYERPDPVMSADANLDNRVTAEEYRAQTVRTFATLDRNRDGRLSQDEIATTCQERR
jgi:Ca2+-binding EF-hand superfamily protein